MATLIVQCMPLDAFSRSRITMQATLSLYKGYQYGCVPLSLKFTLMHGGNSFTKTIAGHGMLDMMTTRSNLQTLEAFKLDYSTHGVEPAFEFFDVTLVDLVSHITEWAKSCFGDGGRLRGASNMALGWLFESYTTVLGGTNGELQFKDDLFALLKVSHFANGVGQSWYPLVCGAMFSGGPNRGKLAIYRVFDGGSPLPHITFDATTLALTHFGLIGREDERKERDKQLEFSLRRVQRVCVAVMSSIGRRRDVSVKEIVSYVLPPTYVHNTFFSLMNILFPNNTVYS